VIDEPTTTAYTVSNSYQAQATKRSMNYQKATRIVETICTAVISTQSSPIEQVFSALVFLDGHQIMQRAELFLAETGHEHLNAMSMAGDDPLHRLTMDVFYTMPCGQKMSVWAAQTLWMENIQQKIVTFLLIQHIGQRKTDHGTDAPYCVLDSGMVPQTL
jgi:hypothetical protein